jgi:predicted GNAT family acetyltransferase
MSDFPEYAILVNSEQSRIETVIDGRLSKIDFQLNGGKIIYYHTEVPPELGGRGIASSMARFALEYAREQRLGVVPLCPFVAAYIERHPDYQSLVVDSD